MTESKRAEITAEPGKQEITVSRDFDASPELVFRAYSDPKLIVRWYGCKDMTTKVDRFDPKTGGSYRFIQNVKNGGEFGIRGVYHEVVSSKKTVRTFEFEGFPGHVVLETTQFEPLPGDRTRVITQSVFQSVEDRDRMLESGVEKGTNEAQGQLDELLKELRST
jgi:uncharacterized protein YndB with AHSA1/START domain